MEDDEDIFDEEFLIDTDYDEDYITFNDDWDDDTEDMPLEPYTEDEWPDDYEDIFDDEIQYEE